MSNYQKIEPRRTQAVAPRKVARPARTKPKGNKAKGAGEGFRLSVVFGFVKEYASFIIFVLAIGVLVVVYQLFTSSQVFALQGVLISPVSQPVRTEVEQTVRRAVGESRLMEVDLHVVRKKVEALARVREASVARVLPDKIFVEVIEREPAVLVRRGNGALVWLDEEAVEVGEFALPPGSTRKVPPPAVGFAEGALTAGAIAENRERVTLYQQIERELTAGESLWNKVDEIDLSSTRYVNVRLANSTINVALGSENFRSRFETAVGVLKAVEDYDVEQLSRYNVRDVEQVLANADNISFIYPAKNNGIVFNFSTPNSERRVTAGTQPKAAKAASEAVVKAATPTPAVARVEAKTTSPAKSAAQKNAKKTNAKQTDDKKKAVKKASASAQGKSQAGKKQAPGKKR